MYDSFARVYDKLQDTDYNSFVNYYEEIFERFGIHPELVLDLACGTGNITVPMAKRGYDMIGVDISEEMLGIAADKARDAECDILFLNQDMTEFELYGTVDAAVCALDGVNYLTLDGELEQLLALVKNYLNPGGLFIFDINSEHKLKNILGGNTFVYDEEDVYCVWSSDFDDEDSICGFNLDFFIKGSNGMYERSEEYHEERAYSTDEIISAAEESGLEVVGCYADRSFDKPNDTSKRIFFVLKK